MADDRRVADWLLELAGLNERFGMALGQLNASDETAREAQLSFQLIADDLGGMRGPTRVHEQMRRRLYDASRSMEAAARMKAAGSRKWRHAFAGGEGAWRRYVALLDRLPEPA
jgi:hypothetical protein